MDRRALSMWWNQDTWDLARSAFVAELDVEPPGPDTLLGWIVEAISAHAARSPAARAELVAELSAGGGAGFSKVHQVPASTVEAVGEALVQDRRSAGRLLSRSAWVREAVHVAAAEAERAHGGQLPAPPARLSPGPGRDR